MAVLFCILLCLAAQSATKQLKRDSLFSGSIFDESLINSKNVELIPVENFPNIFDLFNEPLGNNSDVTSVEYHDESLESSEERKEATEPLYSAKSVPESSTTLKPLIRDQLTQDNIKSKINQQLQQRFRPLRKKKKGPKSSKGSSQSDQDIQQDSTSPIAKAYGKPGKPFGGQRKPYHFAYSVKNKYGNNFNQEETSDGNTITGQYRVLLPDGRLQTVVYIADWKHGYNAVVTYEAVSKVDEHNHEAPKLPKRNPIIPKALFHRPTIEKQAYPTVASPLNNKQPNYANFAQPIINHPGIVQPILNHQPEQPHLHPQQFPVVNHHSILPSNAPHPQQDKHFRPSPPDNSFWYPMQPHYDLPPHNAHHNAQPVGPQTQNNIPAEKLPFSPDHVVFQHHDYKINHPTPGGYSQVHYRQTIESNSAYDSDTDYNYSNLRYAHKYPGMPIQQFQPQFLIHGQIVTNRFPQNARYHGSESQKSVKQSPPGNSAEHSNSNQNLHKSKPTINVNVNDRQLTNSKLAGHVNNIPYPQNQANNGVVYNPGTYASSPFFRPNFAPNNETLSKPNSPGYFPTPSNQHPLIQFARPTITVPIFPHIHVMSSNGIFRPELANQSRSSAPTVEKPESVSQVEKHQLRVYRKQPESNLSLRNSTTFGISLVTPSLNVQIPGNASQPAASLPKDFVAKSIFAHINSLRIGNPIPAHTVIKSLVENAAQPSLNVDSAETTPTPNYKSSIQPRYSRGRSSFKIQRLNESLVEGEIPSTIPPSTEKSEEGSTTGTPPTVTPNINGAITEQELELLQLSLNKTSLDPPKGVFLNASLEDFDTTTKGTVTITNARDNYIKIKRVRYRKPNINGTPP